MSKIAQISIGFESLSWYIFYADGLYWSIITAGSIGYGDITPKTVVGKIIAAFLGLIGVITIGVIAGLILKWITPRPLE